MQSIIFPISADIGHPEKGRLELCEYDRNQGNDPDQSVLTSERIQAVIRMTEMVINTICCQLRRGFSSCREFFALVDRLDIDLLLLRPNSTTKPRSGQQCNYQEVLYYPKPTLDQAHGMNIRSTKLIQISPAKNAKK